MSIKNRAKGIEPSIKSRDVKSLSETKGNLYEVLNIIARRAKQIGAEVKIELNSKLDEFAVTVDSIEEITENKEQIEISKFYERLANPVLIAMDQYDNEELEVRYRSYEEDEGDQVIE